MLSSETPTAWVQVLGRVAVHQDGTAKRLTGSGQRLVAVLVAAGPDGATAERIAEEIWGTNQPNPWRPALRMAVTRLRKRLPSGWDIIADGGSYRLATGDGWVDAWRLEQTAASSSAIQETDLEWMLAGSPFGDLDLLEMVAASTQNLKLLQVALAERFCAQAPETMSTATCWLLSALMRDHQFNDRLALAVASVLASAGRRNEALVALRSFADSFTQEIGELPVDIADFLESRGQAITRVDAGMADQVSTATSPASHVAKELRHLAESSLLGRQDELVALRSETGALLIGPAGSGKSRLLAELIAVDDQRETTYVVGDDRLDVSLGPFAVAMPQLREELLAVDSLGAELAVEERPQPTAFARAWRIVLGHLEQQSAVRPQRLIVDDAHLLDPVSLGLLRLLIRSNTTADLAIIVAGRDDFDDAGWHEVVRDAERAGLQAIPLAGLDLEELEHMVFQRFPTAIVRVRNGLALEVFEASGGLPAVAAPLIAAADPDTLALPEQLDGLPALARVTAALSERAPEVLAAAAVLGHQFSIGALIALTALDEAAVFSVLDELWSTNLIVETDDPDQVRFRHVLIQRAFLEGVPLFRRGRLHAKAADLTEDPHQRADHLVNAISLVSADVAATSLLASARLYASRLLWRKAARELRRVEDLGGEHLDTTAHTLWATALDYSGSDGSMYRQIAYDQAVASGDWNAALDAALSALPQAERPDGDRERIAMIEAIPVEQLTAAQRFARLSTLARQYTLLGGENAKAIECAEQAIEAATNSDELGSAYVLRWAAARHYRPETGPIPADFAVVGSLPVRLRIAQISAINRAEEGDYVGARTATDSFFALATEHGNPFRLWHARALEGLFLLNDGDFDGAEAVALENLNFANMHDIQQGTASYIGYRVFLHDAQDRLADLQSELEPFRANLAELLLGRTALAMCAHAAGEDPTDEIRSIVTESTRNDGGTMSVLTMMFLARFLPTHAPELVVPARKILERFGDKPVLASFGAASFGPTVRYVAQLALDPKEKAELVAQSIAAADRHQARIWRVRTRLDSASLGSKEALAEAAELAKGSGLESVVERFATNLGR